MFNEYDWAVLIVGLTVVICVTTYFRKKYPSKDEGKLWPHTPDFDSPREIWLAYYKAVEAYNKGEEK